MEQQQANAVTLMMTPEAISAMLSAMYLKDADFRAAFDKDPKAAIAKVSGHKMAADAKVVVHRNEDKCWHITLPSQEAVALLSDQEISGVSGGTGGGAPQDILGTFHRMVHDAIFGGSPGGSTLTAEQTATVTDALATLTDTYTTLFGTIAAIGRGGGTP